MSVFVSLVNQEGGLVHPLGLSILKATLGEVMSEEGRRLLLLVLTGKNVTGKSVNAKIDAMAASSLREG